MQMQMQMQMQMHAYSTYSTYSTQPILLYYSTLPAYSTHQASTYAEIAFDQMQMHADLRVVDGDVAGNMLDKARYRLARLCELCEAVRGCAGS